MTVHACPPNGSGLTPCCRRTPFELPRTDRITEDPDAVTCTSPWRLLGIDLHAFAWAETVASHGTGPTATIDMDINVPGHDEPVPVEIPLADARTLHAMLGDVFAEHDEPVPADTNPGAGTLRDRIAAAIWERQNPGRHYADCEHPWMADAEADADAVLAVIQPELDELADYRNRITWETTCGEHAALLDACRGADERAEKAEVKAAAALAECDRADRMLGTDGPTFRTAAGARIMAARIRAALNGTEANQ